MNTIMNKEIAKKQAEILLAYAEGNKIECKLKLNVKGWRETRSFEMFDFDKYDYRVKPESKKRRMYNVEAADWLRDNPQEHREFKYKDSTNDTASVWHEYPYDSGKENEPCEDILIRRNHGEWEEPMIEVEE